MNIDWYQTYPIAEAERGKFSPIDLSTLSPAYSGRGRYAVLTYSIGNEPGSISAANYVIQVNPNTTYNMSSTVAAHDLYTVTFPTPVNHLEIYTNEGEVYLTLNDGTTTYEEVTATGIPIESGIYYTNNYETAEIKLAATVEADVRIFGSYRV